MDELHLPDVPPASLLLVKSYLSSGILDVGSLTAAAAAKAAEQRDGTEADRSSLPLVDAAAMEKPEVGANSDAKEGEPEEGDGGAALLAVDGFSSVQSLLHLCGLWCLDHLASLVEAAVLDDLPRQGERGSGGGERMGVPASLAAPMLGMAAALGNAPRLKVHCLRALKRAWPLKDEEDAAALAELSPDLQKEVHWYVRSLLL